MQIKASGTKIEAASEEAKKLYAIDSWEFSRLTKMQMMAAASLQIGDGYIWLDSEDVSLLLKPED